MRRGFLINLLLAFCWTAVTGELSAAGLLVGFAIGFLVMLVARPLLGPPRYAERLMHLFVLVGLFLWDLLSASLRISVDALTPRHEMKSGVISVPMDLESDAEITVLANLISLTPGSLSLDLSDDGKTLFIHVMHIGDKDVAAYRQDIKRKLETRVRRVFGEPSGPVDSVADG